MNSKENIALCVVADFKYLYKNFNRIYTQIRTEIIQVIF